MPALKKPKDPNAPKRPMSGYFAWLQKNRETMKQSQSELKGRAVVKLLGDKWAKMSEEEKAPWEKEARIKKEKYDRELEAYKKTPEYQQHQAALEEFKKAKLFSGSVSGRKGKRKFKKPVDPEAPKRPQSGYFMWLNESREKICAQNPGVPNGPAIVKLAGQKWAAMTDEEKKPFLDKAEKAKAQYHLDLEAYKKTDSYSKFQERLQEFEAVKKKASGKKDPKPKRPKRAKTDPNAPKKPPSAFDVYAEQTRSEVDPSLSATAKTNELRTRWRVMSEEEKKPFLEGAKKCKEAYKGALQKYLAESSPMPLPGLRESSNAGDTASE